MMPGNLNREATHEGRYMGPRRCHYRKMCAFQESRSLMVRIASNIIADGERITVL
jgi:hypothetical protein